VFCSESTLYISLYGRGRIIEVIRRRTIIIIIRKTKEEYKATEISPYQG
jgi:hypothetical protein